MIGDKYASVARMSAVNRLVYWGELLVRGALYVLLISVMMGLWKTIYSQGRPAIQGFGIEDMIIYLVCTEAILLAWPEVHRTMSREVVTGEIAYRLLRPVDFLGMHLARYLGAWGVAFAMNLGIGAVLCRVTVGRFPPIVDHLSGLAAVVILAALLNFGFVAMIGLFAFWMEEVHPLFWIYQKALFIFGGLLVPLDMFPDWLAAIASSLPFKTMLYVPARLAVRWDAALFHETVMLQLVWLAVLIALTRTLQARAWTRLSAQGG